VFQLSPEPKEDGAAVIYRFRYTGKIYLITSVKLGRVSVFDGDGCGGVGDREGCIQIILEGSYHSLQLLDAGRDRLLILLQTIENLVGIGLDVGFAGGFDFFGVGRLGRLISAVQRCDIGIRALIQRCVFILDFRYGVAVLVA